jgi:hypothetical protein
MRTGSLRAVPVLIALSMLAAAPQAKATIITLTEDACTGTCGSGPFGTIELIQTTATLVTVTLTLSANERFAGTGAGEALAFNVAGLAVTIGSITANFGVGPAPASASAFGSFLQSVSCTTCKGGNAGNPAGPLSFTVTRATGVTIADFGTNAKGYMFASDIVGTNGNTGNVGAFGIPGAPGGSVPEPVTMSLMGGGLLMIALRRAHLRSQRK